MEGTTEGQGGVRAAQAGAWVRRGGLLIAALGVAVYAWSLNAAFLFDDWTAIVRNAYLRTLEVSLGARWVVDFTYKLNLALHGLRPAGFRAVNVAIHIGNGLLLLGILRRLLRRPAGAPVLGGRLAEGAALAAAALWTVHPLQTESVTYLCQRSEALMGLCFLGTVLAFLRGVEAQERGARGAWWFGVSVLVCLLGMGTKEVMAAAPATVLLLDLVLMARAPREAWRRRWAVHLGLWLTLAALAVFEVRMLAGSVRSEQVQVSAVTPWQYLLTQAGVLLWYLRLVVAPYPLCLDYDWPVVAGWREVWPALLVMAGSAGAAAWGVVRRRPWAVGPAVALLTLAPTSSLVPVHDAAFEHRMYLALAGILAPLAAGVARGMDRDGLRRLRLPAAVAVVLAAGVLTVVRNRDYRSELAMWTRVVAVRPANLRGRSELAVALSEAGRVDEAKAQYALVLASIPAADRARFERGDVRPGSFPTRSTRYLFFRAHANRGALRLKAEGDVEGAVRDLVLALRVAPRHPTAEATLREALARLGVAPGEMQQRIAGLVTGALPLP